MAVLQSTNVVGALCVNGVAVGGGKNFKYCCFTSSTSFTPSQDLVDGDGALEAFIVGGGGGGGGSFLRLRSCGPNLTCCGVVTIYSGPGGGGSFGSQLIKITGSSACTVTVGAGGTGGGAMEDPDSRCNYNVGIQNSATTGGNSTMGAYTSFGGGGGANMWQCVQTCSNTATATQTYFTSPTRNGASSCGFRSYCIAGYMPSDSNIATLSNQVLINNGGSSYVEDLPTSSFANSTAGRSGIDYINYNTGSGNILNSFSNPNGTMIDGVAIGAAGYATTLGGAYSGMSASNPTTFFPTNTFQNMDLGVLNGVVGMLTNNENFSPINQTWSTASNYPNKYYGAGGKSGIVQLYSKLCIGDPLGDLRGQINGGDGNDGIVVLKWSE